MERIIVLDILKKGFGVYKDNFKLLFGASLLYAAISLLDSLGNLFNSLYKNGLFSFVGYIVTFATMYFTCRVLISVTIIVRDLIEHKETTFGRAFTESSQYFWRYIGNMVL